MRDMERLKPAVVGPTNLQAIDTRDPRLKPGSGKGSGPQLPGSGTSFEPDRRPQRSRKSHKVRNSLLVSALGVAGAGVYVGTQGGTESSPTTTPVVTTIDIKPTSPSDPVTTSVEPSTTVEQKPTDVVEHRDGYDVLRNGGLLYEVESAPEFGGFELHIESGGVTFGFGQAENGAEKPQEVLFRDMLWTFGNQHSEFIMADGQVDVEAYKKYLEDHNWTDTVYLPKNISTQAHTKLPPVAPSDPVELDFRKPFVLGNTGLSLIDGFTPENANYYLPTVADTAMMLFGVTNDGQLFYGSYEINPSTSATKALTMKHPYESYPISELLGIIMTITSRITYPEKTPQDQWSNPYTYFINPFMVTPANIDVPYPVLDVFDFVGTNAEKTKGTNALFAPVTS